MHSHRKTFCEIQGIQYLALEGGIQQAHIPPPGAGANYYILFGHSLHSTLQAPTSLYEAMSSQCTPYPGAPFLLYFYIGHFIQGLTPQGRH